jgi:hypothetical protein
MKNFYFIMEIVIFSFGLFSNTLGVVTLILSKKLKHIGTKNMHIVLFVIDFIFLLITTADRVSLYQGYDLVTYSSVSCKLYPFLNRILASLSPMVLVFIFSIKKLILFYLKITNFIYFKVFITLERYVSLESGIRNYMLRKKSKQIYCLMAIIIYNVVYYLPCVFFFEIRSVIFSNFTNQRVFLRYSMDQSLVNLI